MRTVVLFLVVFSMVVSCKTKRLKDDAGNTIYSADSAITDFNKGMCRILEYGEKMPSSFDFRDSLAKKYGLTFFAAAGCEVSEEFIQGVNEYNAKMEDLLKVKNGPDWRARLNKEINTLHMEMIKDTGSTSGTK